MLDDHALFVFDIADSQVHSLLVCPIIGELNFGFSPCPNAPIESGNLT
jgi:hypothetical protein